ncbi:MAG TPA: hypothetical protein VFA04_15385 [Bryobacteraceae bacterium]|nr:hypothetical protein [Bryobacteraceae bacterium]
MAKYKVRRGPQKQQNKFQINKAALPCLVLVIVALVIIALVLYFAFTGGSS